MGRQNGGSFGERTFGKLGSRMKGVVSGEKGGLYLGIYKSEAVSVACSLEGTRGLSGGYAWIIGVNPIRDNLDVPFFRVSLVPSALWATLGPQAWR